MAVLITNAGLYKNTKNTDEGRGQYSSVGCFVQTRLVIGLQTFQIPFFYNWQKLRQQQKEKTFG